VSSILYILNKIELLLLQHSIVIFLIYAYEILRQYSSNIVDQYWPNIGQQCWPMLAQHWPTILVEYCRSEVANIRPILYPIFIQYCTACFTNIGPIFRPLLAQHWWNIVEAWNSQYWGNIYCNIGPMVPSNIWLILNFIVNM